MEWSKGTIKQVYCIRFDHEEDLIVALTDFVKEKQIKAGMVHFIGALKKMHMVSGPKEDLIPPEPYMRTFSDVHEIVGIGTIAWDGDAPSLHLHASGGRHEHSRIGCVREMAQVFIIIEAVIYEFDGLSFQKKVDLKTGIDKLHFED